MNFIATEAEVKEYMARLERQKEILKLSPAFSDTERKEVTECYERLIEISKKKLNKLAKG